MKNADSKKQKTSFGSILRIMKIKISTQVDQSMQQVWQNFDENLFLKLAPPFPPVKLLRFDGCKKNDVVQLELNFFGFKQRWDALIIENYHDENEIYFIDKGTALPFFLKSWHHKHQIIAQGNGSIILDNIDFNTKYVVTDFLIYPLLYLQFLYRKPIYKKYFKA